MIREYNTKSLSKKDPLLYRSKLIESNQDIAIPFSILDKYLDKMYISESLKQFYHEVIKYHYEKQKK